MSITKDNKKFLYDVTAKLAMRDFLLVNPKRKVDKKTGLPIFKPYSLSEDTLEALEYYKLSIKENLTLSEEQEVKAYILKRKLIYD